MPTSGSRNHAPRITIFTSPACHWCMAAKRHLAEKGLAYREVDISSDRKGRQDMVRMTGQCGVPVLLVGGHAMVGWDAAEFQQLLSGRFKQR